MKPESVNVNASKLLADAKVSLRVKELQKAAQQRHQLTVDDLLNELEEARQIAMGGERPQCAAAVSATMGKAKLLGFDSPKPETPTAHTYSFSVHRAGTEPRND